VKNKTDRILHLLNEKGNVEHSDKLCSRRVEKFNALLQSKSKITKKPGLKTYQQAKKGSNSKL
jgi:hypothetical protein